ncbi:MAG: hypothetical protein H0T60_04635 [Acidobacteria bacterium]|nr:hypothetical protein [Acidobacteriota bacterium]
MRTTIQAVARILSVCALVCILMAPCSAQKVKSAKAVPKNDPAFALIADGQEVFARVRALQHPASRAFLYPQIAALLWERVGADADLRWVAIDASTVGLADILKHQHEIPRASIVFFYSDLIRTVRRYDAEEAKRLEQSFPLDAASKANEQETVRASFQSALVRYEKGIQQSPQSLSEVVGLIGSGKVPSAVLIGEVFRLDQAKSPALPDVLSATLSLEEKRAGSLSFMTMFFVSHVYLKDSTPLNLRKRFLAATLTSVTARMDELRNDPEAFRSATQLLQRSLPFMQALTPSLYPQAASLLASLAPNLLQTETAWTRIKASADPFEQTLTEANSTSDSVLKKQLLESAARLAHQRGDLRRAVDLMVAEEEGRSGLPDDYSYHHEFLDKIVQDAIKTKDIETADYAVSKMNLPLYRVESLRKIARHYVESKDISRTDSTLNEAIKVLRDAPDGSGKIISYLRLSTDLARVNKPRASEMIRAAAKAVDAVTRPDKDEQGEFSRTLYPLLNETISTFRLLARDDRAEALNAVGLFNVKEFGVAAAIGINSSPHK